MSPAGIFSIISLCLLTNLKSSRGNPCEEYAQLPNPYDRYLTNNISGSAESILHDRHIEEGWYRVGYALDMPNTPPPSHLHCGTTFPVWMNGSIPSTSEGESERSVCFLGHVAGNFCVHHIHIKVKNCGVYRVYYLPPTPSNDEAYCFGTNRADIENDNSSLSVTTTSVTDDVTTSSEKENVTSKPELDPCYNYSPLPNAYDRYYSNVLNGSTGALVHDRHLVEGWYRAGHSLDMPNITPSLLHCGTIFPAWMNGSIPSTSEGEAVRRVCFLGHIVGNFCAHHIDIKVKNCGIYRVYHLPPTPSNDEAYCFGTDRIDIENDNSSLSVTTTSVTDDVTTSSEKENVTSKPELDPCYNYSPLPNAYDRYYSNVLNGSTGVLVHDRHLEEGWYRAGHSLDMPNITPSLLHCGTIFPAWMDGEIPDTTDGVAERKVCFLGHLVGNYCVHHLQILVKNCGVYRVYYLYPTPSNDEAYCFGMEKTESTTSSVGSTTPFTLRTTATNEIGNSTISKPQETTTNDLELELTTSDQYSTADYGTSASHITISTQTTQQLTTNSTTKPHTTSQADPCLSYSILPNYEDRFIQNVVNENSSFIDDKDLPKHWYRAGNLDIPVIRPTLYHCGTVYPGYLTGSIPNVTAGVVTRTVCFYGDDDNWCHQTVSINVKNCGTYRVYFLKPTDIKSSGYCFGSNPSTNVTTTTFSTTQTTRDSSATKTTLTTTDELEKDETTLDQYTSTVTTIVSNGTAMTTNSSSTTRTTVPSTGVSVTNSTTAIPQITTTENPGSEMITNASSTPRQTKSTTHAINVTNSTTALPHETTTNNPSFNLTGNISSSTQPSSQTTLTINATDPTTLESQETTLENSDYSVPTTSKPNATIQSTSQHTTTTTTQGNTTQSLTSTTMLQTRTSPTTGSPIFTSSPSSTKPNETESTDKPSTTSTAFTTPVTVDPCVHYTNLTNIQKRFHTNQIQADPTSSLSDHLLVYGWYGTGEYNLLTSSAMSYHCGTFYPIWINGNIPTVEDGVVDRTACIVTDTECGMTISIKIRNCGTYRVYQLRPTIMFSAYCIYEYNALTTSKPSSPPTTAATQGNTTQSLTSTTILQTTKTSTTTESPIFTSSPSSMNSNWTESTDKPSSITTAFTTPGTVDHCVHYTNLTNVEKRFHTNRIQANSTSSLSDHSLVNGWYGTGEYDLLTSSAISYHCGTFYPIWINGNIPTVEDGEVNRTACIVTDTDCGMTFSVKIRNCGTYRVYQLRPTVVFSAYCIYDYNAPTTSKPTSPPTTATTQGNTTQSLTSTTMLQTTNTSTTTESPIFTSSPSSMKPNWTESTDKPSSITTGFTTPVTVDPCVHYTNLTNIEKRFHTNQIQADPTSSLSDHLLVNGWYGTGEYDLLTSSAMSYHCGTFYPIWIKGNIPMVEDGEVNRTACMVTDTDCGMTFSVRIRNCGTHRVYQLRPTVVFSAYCIYDYNAPTTSKPTSRPTTATTQGNTTQSLTSTTMLQTTNTSTTTESPIFTSSPSSMKPDWTESTDKPSTTTTAFTTPVTVDPCVHYTNLTNIEKRFHTNQIQANSTSSLSDHSLVNGWYGTGEYDLLTSSAMSYHCGTFYTIWINGNIPTVEDGEVNRTACIVTDTNCGMTFSVKIRNCGTHRVYQLRPTVVFSAYCIYDYNAPTISKPTSPPTTATTQGNTTQSLTSTTMLQTIKTSTTTESPIFTSSPSSMKPDWTESTDKRSTTSKGFTTPVTVDPCVYYTNLTNIEKRFHTNQIQANSTTILSDQSLVYGWYGTGEYDLLTSSAMSYHCGTFYPIWINGKIPLVEDGVVDRTACIVTDTDCGMTISVKIRNCGTYRVYQLQPTFVFSAYCIYDASVPTTLKPNTTIQSSSPQTTTITNGNTTQSPTSTTMIQSNTSTESPIPTSSYSSMKPTSTPVTVDPCVHYTNLTNIEKRFHTNQIQANSTSSLSDHSLVYGWYGTGKYDLLTSSARRYHCGTINPIWINGSVSLEEDGEVDRTACIVTNTDCGITISVKIRNCGTHRVYQLRQTIVSSAYCIYDTNVPTTSNPMTTIQMSSTSQQTPSPSPTLSSAEVEVHLVPDGISQVFQARCTFNASNASGFRFNITWYFDDVFDSSFSATLENIYRTYIYLQRDNFKTLGRNISCGVDMLSNDGTIIEARKSQEQFLGIKILTPVVTFKRGEEGKIKLQLTVPIGCLQLVSQCDVILAMMDQSEDQCTGAAVSGQRDCGISLKSREWTKIYEIPVGAIEEEGHTYSATYEVVLRTDAHFHQPIWGLYELPPVKIVIQEGSDREWSKKYCRAVNDPHLLTFDQRPYDVHLKGDFIMYEHKTAPIQVQARFKPCYGNSGPHCTCGVAVQAGRDVFVIDRCESRKRLRRMMYTSCMDHTLEVRKRHDYLYNMYTPYGTRIQVNLRGKTYMNLQIYPSIRDVGQTRGLCGTLSNECADDFLLRNGNYLNEPAANKSCGNFGWSDYRWEPDSFSRSWMVAENESLFEDYDPSNAEWPRERYLCSCKKNVVKMRIDGRGTPDCSSSVVSNCTRRREKVVAVGGGCEVKRSSKYGLKHYDVTRVRRQEPNQRRIKRVVSHIPLTTINNATSFCQNHLSKSKAFTLCEDIPNVNKEDAIETCALDIVLTNGSLEWADNPKEAMIDRCVSELRLNATLNTESNNTPSVAEVIRNIACPNDCSGIGTCVNGTCVCPPLYGASDCSLNVSVPPEIYGIEGDGLCDVSQMSCDQILIAGDDFTETGSYNCKIEIAHILFDGATSSAGLTKLNGDMQTLMSISCPVPVREKFASRSVLRTSPVFVRTFSVSLSSDGNIYSESFQFYEYNSTYQDLEIVDGKPKFSLKSGYCFIDEEGIPDGWRQTTNICNACNSSVSVLEWTPVKSQECEVIREPVEKSFFDSTELYWMLGLTIAIILIILMVVCQHRCRRIRSKRKFSYDVSSESSFSGIELQDPSSVYF